MSDVAAPPASPTSDAEGGGDLDFLSFDVEEETYAFPLGAVHEILRPPPLTPVPRAPDYVLGVISVRGTIVTVFDPNQMLGLCGIEEASIGRVLMVDNGVERVGVAVSRVLQVERLGPPDIEVSEPGDSDFARFVVGVGRPRGYDDDRMLILLDPVVLLGDR